MSCSDAHAGDAVTPFSNARWGKSGTCAGGIPTRLCPLPEFRRNGRNSSRFCWHGLCSLVGIVKPVRSGLSAVALIIAILGTATIPAFAAAAHPVCLAKQHDCGKTPSIRRCCCGDQSDGSDQSIPVPGKTSVHVTFVPVAAVFTPTGAPNPDGILVRAQASPPRAAPVDFPTLFASLLI